MKWIPVYDKRFINIIDHYKCPYCSVTVGDDCDIEGDVTQFDYCPKCGKRMTEVDT